MAARWCSFTFAADEEPVADTGWSRPKPTVDSTLPLGGARESVVVLGIGAKRRTIELYLSLARLRILQLFSPVGMYGILTDWEAVPVTENCILLACDVVEAITGSYGTTAAKRRVRMEFLWSP